MNTIYCPRCSRRNSIGYSCLCQLASTNAGSNSRAIVWLLFLGFCAAIAATVLWIAANV